nr:four-helix bundle copper-binding protein [Halorussus ruber]
MRTARPDNCQVCAEVLRECAESCRTMASA